MRGGKGKCAAGSKHSRECVVVVVVEIVMVVVVFSYAPHCIA